MKTGSFMIILFFLSVTLSSGCTNMQTLETDEKFIISSFTEHQASIRDYSGTVSLNTERQVYVPDKYRIYVRYPDNYKVEYIESPDRHPGTITILERSSFLEYDPVNNATIFSEVNPEGNSLTSRDYLGLLNRIIPQGTAKYVGVAYLEKQPVYCIEIQPNKPGTYFDQKYSEFRFSLVKVWVDPESWAARKIDLYDSDGNRHIASVRYEELSVNTGIADEVFNSRLYQQYTIITAPTHPPVATFPGVEYPKQQSGDDRT